MVMVDDQHLPAGDFSSWLVDVRAAIRGERPAVVPCDDCTACCTSSQFVHIEPDEADTLGCIPSGLLFPAPGRPRGHVVLGYDDRGHCPMLVEGRCSIYAHRPRSCRMYDCRVFAATGVPPEGDGRAAIARQVKRWRFDDSSVKAKAQQEAVRAAVTFLQGRSADGTQLAVRAIMHAGG
jgi:hypothetical protein